MLSGCAQDRYEVTVVGEAVAVDGVQANEQTEDVGDDGDTVCEPELLGFVSVDVLWVEDRNVCERYSGGIGCV